MRAWVKFAAEQVRLTRMRHLSTDRLQQRVSDLSCRIDELDRERRYLVRELDRRGFRYPEES